VTSLLEKGSAGPRPVVLSTGFTQFQILFNASAVCGSDLATVILILIIYSVYEAFDVELYHVSVMIWNQGRAWRQIYT